MDILEFEVGNKSIRAGLPSEGTLQCVFSFKYFDGGKLQDFEVHIAGYCGEDDKYKFLHAKNELFETIKIKHSIDKNFLLPEQSVRHKPVMPDEHKIEWYKRLKKDLESRNLI